VLDNVTLPDGYAASTATALSQFATRQAAQSEVMDWLAFYNARRLHSTLGYVSPMRYEKNCMCAWPEQHTAPECAELSPRV